MLYNRGMNYRVVNLKIGSPPVDVAIGQLEIEIRMCMREGVKCLKVIHGYGSHGVGGEIKKALGFWLVRAKRRGVIRDFVKGEHWVASDKADKFKKVCPQLLGDPELYHSNSGVTIILLNADAI